jgi:hypothetical protein
VPYDLRELRDLLQAAVDSGHPVVPHKHLYKNPKLIPLQLDEEYITVTYEGWVAASNLMWALEADPRVSESVGASELQKSVERAIILGVLEGDRFDANVSTETLLQELLSDHQTFYVMMAVPGLKIEHGYLLDVGAVRFGSLTDLERAAPVTGLEPLHYSKDGGGSGASGFREFYAADECWARTSVYSRFAAAQDIAREKVDVLALSVLRCFSRDRFHNPENLSLGEPCSDYWRRTRIGKQALDIDSEGARTLTSRYDRRQDLRLFQAQIEMLRQDARFKCACEAIAQRDRTDLQDKVVLAMVQFATATTIGPKEVRLPAYLTVLEVLFGRDSDADYGRRHKNVVKRAAEVLYDTLGGDVAPAIDRLYQTRRGPVHYGHRNLHGRIVVSENDTGVARHFVHNALMLGLERAGAFSTHASFLAAIDGERIARLEAMHDNGKLSANQLKLKRDSICAEMKSTQGA